MDQSTVHIPRPWTDRYIGLTADELCPTWPCWALVRAVYKHELDIHLPDYGDMSGADLVRIREDEKHWSKAAIPQTFDVVLLRGKPYHIGIVTGRRSMLHVDTGIDACIEDFEGLEWHNKVIGFYRYER